MAGFKPTSGVKVMAQNWSKGLKRFGASALAAPVGVLRSFAEAVEAGEQEAPSLRHFVVSFTGGEQGELAEDDRERFWRVFQVPVFEQRLGFDGRVIAYECEAHDGLHIVPERAAIEETAHSELLLTSLTDLRRPTLRVGTRLGGSIQHDCCDCGNAASRLIGARPLPAPRPLAAAAC
jgi:phenylacetate-CoA ligase